MDDLIFEMNQPNELVTHSEWTEWWVVDEKGLRLEYADGWSAEQEYGLNEETETFVSEESIFRIWINVMMKNYYIYQKDTRMLRKT